MTRCAGNARSSLKGHHVIVEYCIDHVQFLGEFRDWEHFRKFKAVEAEYNRKVVGAQEFTPAQQPAEGARK